MAGKRASKSTELQTKLTEYLRGHGRSMVGLSAVAHVSTRTIQLIKNGEIKDWKRESPRAMLGFAASLARLAVHLQASPEGILREYGLDPDSQAIRETVGRAGMAAVQNQVMSDVTFDAIRGRGVSRNLSAGQVKVIALNWEPFVNDSEAHFARLYTEMLLGAFDPQWEILEFKKMDSIPDAIQDLLSPKKEWDMIFGLYETGYRRSLGVAFVDLPGIKVSLDVLIMGERPKSFDWSTVIDPPDNFTTVFAVAIQEEAGAHVAVGLSRYPSGSRSLPNTNDPAVLYEALLDAHKSVGKSRTVFLIADRFTCGKVQRYADEMRRGGPLLSKLCPEGDEEEKRAPQFSVGIGVRGDSPNFAELAIAVTRREMFAHALPRIARLYVDLFSQIDGRHLIFSETDFIESMGETILDAFRSAIMSVVVTNLQKAGKGLDGLGEHPVIGKFGAPEAGLSKFISSEVA